MHILHYSLGFPPYRTGGLTKFCMDIMKQQIDRGHDVALMWPGKLPFFNKYTAVKSCGKINVEGYFIKSFEVINPLPVSFDEGISCFSAFVESGNMKPYLSLLKEFSPDVVHIHTLMGLHKCFLEAVKESGIRLVFTAHDFFPICPKVTMYRHGQICDSMTSCKECGACNETALSLRKIQILQSPLYRKVKDFSIMKRIRKHHRNKYLGEITDVNVPNPVGSPQDYRNLRAYYGSMIRLMDIAHFNSTVTKQVYESVFGDLIHCVIPISHSDIADHRKVKKFLSDKIRIRYLGPYGGAKGFFYLKEALDKVWNERQDFCLDVHFVPPKKSPYMITHGRYTYSELAQIFNETDVLVAPSVWYETFGYTVLEALSYGVPVIITETVGAKDILTPGSGIIVNDVKGKQLYEIFKCLSIEQLQSMNQAIVKNQKILTMVEVEEQIEKNCYFYE